MPIWIENGDVDAVINMVEFVDMDGSRGEIWYILWKGKGGLDLEMELLYPLPTMIEERIRDIGKDKFNNHCKKEIGTLFSLENDNPIVMKVLARV